MAKWSTYNYLVFDIYVCSFLFSFGNFKFKPFEELTSHFESLPLLPRKSRPCETVSRGYSLWRNIRVTEDSTYRLLSAFTSLDLVSVVCCGIYLSSTRFSLRLPHLAELLEAADVSEDHDASGSERVVRITPTDASLPSTWAEVKAFAQI